MRCIALSSLLFTAALQSQPLLDILTVNGMASASVMRGELSATLPIRLDSGRVFLVDPYYVQWRTTTQGSRYVPPGPASVVNEMWGVGTALTYVGPLTPNWTMALAGIARHHVLGRDKGVSDPQFGGAILLSRKYGTTLTLRGGVYFNHEAFGWFVMPLAGIHWKISQNDVLYGTLPGWMNIEHTVTPRFRTGINFRAYTTSFGTRDGNYIRINENPLGVYTDLYVTPHWVFRAEAGWCILRRVLGGSLDPLYNENTVNRRGYADHGIPDEAYLRLKVMYRIRLDE